MHPRERVKSDALAQERIAEAGRKLVELLGLDSRLVDHLHQLGNDPDLRRLREHEATADLLEAMQLVITASQLPSKAKSPPRKANPLPLPKTLNDLATVGAENTVLDDEG